MKIEATKMAHEIDVAVLAGCSEQALDWQPAQHADFDALPQTGPGLGGEADFLATLASHPPEAVSHEFDAICILPHIAILILGQTPHQFRTVEEHTHLSVQLA